MSGLDYRTKFIEASSRIKTTNGVFEVMRNTVENSPWHREANVLVHTEMVVQQYMRLTDAATQQWSHADFLGALACLFHDTGKPKAEVQKFSEERGQYRSYHGHEVLSSRIWEDYAATVRDICTPEDTAKVAWFIDNHMPWSIKDGHKLDAIVRTAIAYGFDSYTRALLADQYGRIADNQAEKNAAADQWVDELYQRASAYQLPSEKKGPKLIVPIAASGSGKSTYFAQNVPQDAEVFSLDLLRHAWYDQHDYANAFALASADNQFKSKANAEFIAALKRCANSNRALYVDNTNLSAKGRRFYTSAAKTHGFVTEAVLFPVSLQTVIDRQQTRTDKTVPTESVVRQYFSLQAPSFGEFDNIAVHHTW